MTQTDNGFYDDITRPVIDEAGRIVDNKAISLPYAPYAQDIRSLASMRLTREDFVAVMYQALTNSFLLAATRQAGNVAKPTHEQRQAAQDQAAKYIHDNKAFQALVDERWPHVMANKDADTLANYHRLIVDSVKTFAADVPRETLAIDDSQAPDNFKPNLHDFRDIRRVMPATLALARQHNSMTDMFANISSAWDGVYQPNMDSIVLRAKNDASDNFLDAFSNLLDSNSAATFKRVVRTQIDSSPQHAFVMNSSQMASLINTMLHLRNNGVDFTLQQSSFDNNGFSISCQNVYNTNVTFRDNGLAVYQNGFLYSKAQYNRKGRKFAQNSFVDDNDDAFKLLDAALGLRPAANIGIDGNHVALDFDSNNFDSGQCQVYNTRIPSSDANNHLAVSQYRQMIAPVYTSDEARQRLASKLHAARSQFFNDYLLSLADDADVDADVKALYTGVVDDIKQHYQNADMAIEEVMSHLRNLMATDGDIYNNAEMDDFLSHLQQRDVNIDNIKQLYQSIVDETSHYIGEAPVVDADGNYTFGKFNPVSLMDVPDDTSMPGRASVINLLRQIPDIKDNISLLRANDKKAQLALLKLEDDLVTFDEDTSHDYDELRKASVDALDQFKADNTNVEAKHRAYRYASLARLVRYADQALATAGVKDVSVRIDDNGIMRWKGCVQMGAGRANTTAPVHVSGDIGQLFPVDDRGLLKCDFKYSNKKYLAIGNQGFYAIDDHFDSKTGRLRITGYEQLMHRLINQAVDRQLFRTTELLYNPTTQSPLVLSAGKILAWASQQPQFKDALSDLQPLLISYTHANGEVSYTINRGRLGKPNTLVDFMIKNGFAKTPDDVTLANYCKAHGLDATQLVDMYIDANNPTVAGRNLSSAVDAFVANTAYVNYLYANEVPKTLVEDVPGDNRDRELKDTIISDMASMVHFSQQQVHDSTTASLTPTMYHSTYHSLSANLVDHQNTRESSAEDAQFFDEISLGNGGSQGGQRRFTAHQYQRVQAMYKQAIRDNNVAPMALVADTVTRFDDEKSRSLIRTLATERGWLTQASRTPFDRGQMFVSQLLTAGNIAEGVNTTYASFGGWTAEDSCVVSQEFANKHMIDDGTGHYRPLKPGDKLSDGNGNKGVISLVVDRHMDDAYEQQYQKAHGQAPAFDDPQRPSVKRRLATEVGIFKQLDHLDVVFDPEAPMSRQNMGVIGEGMLDKHPQRLLCEVNGKRYDLGTSTKRMVLITKEAVDRNEHVYADRGINDNVGRHFGGLATGVISEYGLSPVLPALLFGYGNQRNWRDVNSMLNVLGYDIAPNSCIYRITDGEVARNPNGFAHPGESYHCYDLGEILLQDKQLVRDEQRLRMGIDRYLANGGFANLKNVNLSKMAAFHAQLQQENMPTVQTMLDHDFGYTHHVSGDNILADANKYDKVALKLPFAVPMLNPQTGKFDGQYQSDTLYIMPSAIRAHSDMCSRAGSEGSDMTRQYGKLISNIINVYAAASKFATDTWVDRNKTPDEAMSRRITRYAHEYQNAKRRVVNSVMDIQRSIYNQLGADGKDSNKKRNSALRNKLFRPAVKDAATLVAHADPRLPLGEIAISKTAMRQMHAKPGDWVLVNRDPMQNTGNWEAMHLAEPYEGEENNLGMAMNPIECAHFDGDFDGDKYGVKHIDLDALTPEARARCESDLAKMSAANTLIDRGHLTHLAIDDGQLGVANGAGSTLGVGVEDVAGWLNLDPQADGLFSHRKYQQALAERHQTMDDVKQLLLGKTDKITKTVDNKQVTITADDAYSVKDFINDQIVAVSKKIVCEADKPQQQAADMRQLDDAIRDLRRNNFGGIQLYVDSNQPQAWLQGFETMAATGAKGNAKKLGLCKQFYEGFANDVTAASAKDNVQRDDGRRTKAFNKAHQTSMRIMQNNTQRAAGIKTDYTGVAGAFEQRLIKVLRDVDPVMACESGAIIYQSLLQARHDQIDALKRVNLLVQLSHWMSGQDACGNKYQDARQQLADGEKLFLNHVDKNLPVPNDRIEKTLAAQSVLQESTIKQFLQQVSSPANKSHRLEDAYEQHGVTAIDELLYGNGVVSIAALADEKQPLIADRQTRKFMPVAMVREAVLCQQQRSNYMSQPVANVTNQAQRSQAQPAPQRAPQPAPTSQPAPASQPAPTSWEAITAAHLQASAAQYARSQAQAAPSQAPAPRMAPPAPHEDGLSF